MKFLVTGVFIFLIGCMSHNSDVSHNPKSLTQNTLTELKFLNRIIDFGDVSNDTLLQAKYTFINTGAKRLIIDFVNPDCTCTDFYLSKDSLKPKDSGYVLLKFSTNGKAGEQKVHATVSANTSIKLYSLEIIANVK